MPDPFTAWIDGRIEVAATAVVNALKKDIVDEIHTAVDDLPSLVLDLLTPHIDSVQENIIKQVLGLPGEIISGVISSLNPFKLPGQGMGIGISPTLPPKPGTLDAPKSYQPGHTPARPQDPHA